MLTATRSTADRGSVHPACSPCRKEFPYRIHGRLDEELVRQGLRAARTPT